MHFIFLRELLTHSKPTDLFIIYLFNFNCYSVTVVPTSPLLLSSALPNTLLPQSVPTLLSIAVGPLYMFLDWILSLLSPDSPLSFPLVTINLFLSSMSLVLFCSFVCFVHKVLLIDEIIQYLPFSTCLTSLRIMLSSSIHAVMKGRSSFFLSAV